MIMIIPVYWDKIAYKTDGLALETKVAPYEE
jgi:hypothetical protein